MFSLSYTYTDQGDIESLLSVLGLVNRLDDVNTGVATFVALTAEEQAYLPKFINRATERCNFYLAMRYNPADLAQSCWVNDHATVIACYLLAVRRGNPVPASLLDMYKETLEELKLVHLGNYEVPLIALREAGIPAFSTVRVDMMYNRDKIRKIASASDRSTPQVPPKRDLGSLWIVEPR